MNLNVEFNFSAPGQISIMSVGVLCVVCVPTYLPTPWGRPAVLLGWPPAVAIILLNVYNDSYVAIIFEATNGGNDRKSYPANFLVIIPTY